MSKIKYVGETALNVLVAKIKSITGTITGVMRFVGSLKELPKDNTSYNKGDVILVGTKEYVLNETDGNKVWVEIGDEGLWISKNDVKANYVGVNEKTTSVKLGIVGNNVFSINFDFSNFITKDKLDNIVNAFVEKSTIHFNVDNNFKFTDDNQKISKDIVVINDKGVEVEIDLTDVYNNILVIKNMITRINNELKDNMKSYFIKSSNITDDGHISLNLKDDTAIAHIQKDNKDIVLNTKKFVEDLKTEFINTGFVHDNSNTKTTFEEITYEEVEKLFK